MGTVERLVQTVRTVCLNFDPELMALSRTMRSSGIHLGILKKYNKSPYICFKMEDIDILSLINHNISQDFLYLLLSF